MQGRGIPKSEERARPQDEHRPVILHNSMSDTGAYLIDPAIIEAQKKRIHARMHEVMAQRTEIIEAFIAKHGIDPDRAEQVIQTMENGEIRYFIRERVDAAQDIVNRVTGIVCAAYGKHQWPVTHEQVMSPSRDSEKSKCRHLVMFILRKHYNMSLEKIAAHMGGRTHATAIHGVKKAAMMIATDAYYDRIYADACKELNITPLP